MGEERNEQENTHIFLSNGHLVDIPSRNPLHALGGGSKTTPKGHTHNVLFVLWSRYEKRTRLCTRGVTTSSQQISWHRLGRAVLLRVDFGRWTLSKAILVLLLLLHCNHESPVLVRLDHPLLQPHDPPHHHKDEQQQNEILICKIFEEEGTPVKS